MQSKQTFLLGSDQGYYPGLLIALLSTVQSLDADGDYHFIILDGGIEDASYAALVEHLERTAQAKGMRLTHQRQQLDLNQFDELPKIWGRSAMTYARILAPDFTQAKSLVWVDADMIIFRDLTQFAPQDPDSTLIAGVTDPVVLELDGDCPIPPAERASDDTSYVNCGLLWMNLERMRSTQFKDRTIEFMSTHREKLTYWDQTALNAMTIGQKEVLPDHYNRFCLGVSNKEVASRVGLANFHMVSPDKPWLPLDAVEHICRDLTFWHLWRILTGEDTSTQIAQVRTRIDQDELKLSRRKTRMNKLLRRPRGFAKWSQRYEDIQYAMSDLENETKAALETWLQADTRPTSSALRP